MTESERVGSDPHRRGSVLGSGGAGPTHVSWMADPAVRAYINRSISGSPQTWPIDWFVEWLRGKRFERGVSIGCGTGPLERDLIRRGLCK